MKADKECECKENDDHDVAISNLDFDVRVDVLREMPATELMLSIWKERLDDCRVGSVSISQNSTNPWPSMRTSEPLQLHQQNEE